MSAIEQSGTETWRLIVVDQQRRHIEVVRDEQASISSLPEVEILRGQRIAEALTKSGRDIWGMSRRSPKIFQNPAHSWHTAY